MDEFYDEMKKTKAEIKEFAHTQEGKCIESMNDWAVRNTDCSLSTQGFSGHAT